MGNLQQDIKQALRAMHKSPALTAIAILSLALGIGATTAIFTVVHQVLLRSFPYKEPDRLVWMWEQNPSRDGDIEPVRPANFADWKARTRVFEDVGLSRSVPPYILTGSGEPESITGYQFSASMFDVLAVKPLLGRRFSVDEDRPGSQQVVVLSYRLWKNRFNGDPQILGRSITLSGVSYTVIGVMPQEFRHPQFAQLWTPLALSSTLSNSRDANILRLIGRLKDGVTREQAERELNSVAQQLEVEHPETNKNWRVTLRPLVGGDTEGIRPVLLALFTAVVLLLVLACTNVANLLMAKATERRREFSVRVALGATRGRLIRQVLSESLALSLIGGAIGLLLAIWGTRLLVHMFPTNIANLDIPLVESLPIDKTVLFFCFGISVFTGLIFGLLPALQSSGKDVVTGLRESSTSYSASRRGKRARNTLVVGEIALALILVMGAGLALKSYQRLAATELGFDPDNLMTFYITMPSYKYKDGDAQRVYMDKLISSLSGVPGVNQFGAVSFLPLSGYNGRVEFTIEGQEVRTGEREASAVQIATPGYFATMRIPLMMGRGLAETDTDKTPQVAVVSQRFARRFFGNADPIGRRLNLADERSPEWVRIVGIVGDVKENGLDQKIQPEIYLPFKQSPIWLMAFALRTAAPPGSIMPSVRQAVWAVDKDQPIARALSMEDAAAESLAVRRITTSIMTLFAGVSLVLACVGIYGVMAFSVVQRTHEFGIRLALGATRTNLLKLVLTQSARTWLIGISLGVLVSLALSKVAHALVYGISTRDPLTFVVTPLLLGTVAILAGLVPALRASRLDPNLALRQE